MTSAVLAGIAALLLASPWQRAEAAPCEWRLSNYTLPDENGVTLDCTCGPPSLGLLDLSELNEALNPDAPEPYEGSILQTVGGVFGTWTYSMNSTICLAAQHAGLIPDPDFGAEIRIAIGPGCDGYEGSTRNGIATADGGPSARSLYFPAVSDGGCPGEGGYRPERLELGTFAAWTAVATPRDDGSWRCLAYSRAEGSEPGDKLWLYLFEDHLRFAPGNPVGDDTRVTVAIDGTRYPMAVRQGYAYIPTSIAAIMSALAAGTMLEIAVLRDGIASGPHAYPLAGLVDANGRMAETCGFDRLAPRDDED